MLNVKRHPFSSIDFKKELSNQQNNCFGYWIQAREKSTEIG